jgi:hypothetical protein
MSTLSQAFRVGERVRALSRPGFPDGTVVKLLDADYVLVRWDGDVLETAHYSQLSKVSPEPST